MTLSAEHRRKMLGATKEQAAAVLEDIQYIRAIAARPDQSVAELRRVSSVLRRLLIERDITAVAAPRIGRLFFTMSDNSRYYAASATKPFIFFGSARPNMS